MQNYIKNRMEQINIRTREKVKQDIENRIKNFPKDGSELLLDSCKSGLRNIDKIDVFADHRKYSRGIPRNVTEAEKCCYIYLDWLGTKLTVATHINIFKIKAYDKDFILKIAKSTTYVEKRLRQCRKILQNYQ